MKLQVKVCFGSKFFSDDSMKSLKDERPSGRFSKSRGLPASVSFLSLPLSPLFSRSNFLLLNPTETLATQAMQLTVFHTLKKPHSVYLLATSYICDVIGLCKAGCKSCHTTSQKPANEHLNLDVLFSFKLYMKTVKQFVTV